MVESGDSYKKFMVQTIHANQIESELERIWDSLKETNKMRACLFNLIIYSKKDQRLHYLDTIIQKVIQKFPSRVIFITHDEKGSYDDLKINVSIMTAEEGENEIICDLIEIAASQKDHPLIPFVILPHLLPDLPIYLVHADDPSEKDPISLKIEHLVNRIIFDSEATTNLPMFATSVLLHREQTKAEVADLNWARMEGWRLLIAHVFRAEEDLNLLKHATTIHIHYNSVISENLCHTNIQSIYLQGWIASQLGWKFQKVTKEKEVLSFFYETDHFPVVVFLHPSQMEEIPSGRIISVIIETNKEYTFTLKRKIESPYQVLIEKSSLEFCSIPTYFILDKNLTGQSLVKEICHKGTSEHYLHLLTLLSTIKDGCLDVR